MNCFLLLGLIRQHTVTVAAVVAASAIVIIALAVTGE